jgi:hypothetical protein
VLSWGVDLLAPLMALSLVSGPRAPEAFVFRGIGERRTTTLNFGSQELCVGMKRAGESAALPLTGVSRGPKRPRGDVAMGHGAGEGERSPLEHLLSILHERGYETDLTPASMEPFFQPPSERQVENYDLQLVQAVKRCDVEALREMARAGKRMDACNRHGESVVHIACRRGNVELLEFLLANGASVLICDDLGRTPLHDACWSKLPQFECVMAILERDLRLLRIVDCRGASPLHYIKREHWGAWRRFFDMKKEEYWAPIIQQQGAEAGAGLALAPVAVPVSLPLPVSVPLPLPVPALPRLRGVPSLSRLRAGAKGAGEAQVPSLDSSSTSSTATVTDADRV